MRSLKNTPTLEAVFERDIDLLIIEELNCNISFVKWFVERTFGLVELSEPISVWHSIVQGDLGESDIVLRMGCEEGVVALLIENKIDAQFQPNQAVRYKQRGEALVNHGECDLYHTVLIAPEAYGDANGNFDSYLSYEKIMDWFLSQGEPNFRYQYKGLLLQAAIDKQRRGYQPETDSNASQFWSDYSQFAESNFPHLGMIKPSDGVPKGSSFFRFRHKSASFDKSIQFIHKGYGAVDIQFTRQADQISDLTEKYGDFLEEGMELVKANKSAAIRIIVPKVDVTQSFQEQKSAVKEALAQLDRLLMWSERNMTN